jgi:hypothetical protein
MYVKPNNNSFFFSDLSCEKPSFINVGDRVQVNINTDSFKQLNKEFGGWNDEMEKVSYIVQKYSQ